jgi:hypothetical protein
MISAVLNKPGIPGELVDWCQKQWTEIVIRCEREVEHRAAMMFGIHENEARNSWIAGIAEKHVLEGDSVLLIVGTVDQGKWIKERVQGAAIVFSKMKVKADGRRADIIEAFRQRDIRCLIATSLADERLDVPCANVLILAGGGRGISKEKDAAGNKRTTVKLEQRAKRVLTVFEGKDRALIYDFFDHQHPMLAGQSWSRFKGHRELGFEVRGCPEMGSGKANSRAKVGQQDAVDADLFSTQ